MIYLFSNFIIAVTVRVVPASRRISSSFSKAYSIVRSACLWLYVRAGVRLNGTDRVLSNTHSSFVLDAEDGAPSIRRGDELVHERCVQYYSWRRYRVYSKLTSSVTTLLLVEQLVNAHQTTSFPIA